MAKSSEVVQMWPLQSRHCYTEEEKIKCKNNEIDLDISAKEKPRKSGGKTAFTSRFKKQYSSKNQVTELYILCPERLHPY